jgi:OPA family glycerol-3-phosphate transporter-like MFS transporter
VNKAPQNSAGELKRWQRRVFASAWITYFSYYLCRLNMPMAKTRLCEAFSWDAASIGLVFSALTLSYAVGQFVNGQLADRFGARAIASLGVLGSVIMNLAVFVVVLVARPETASPRTVLALVTILWGANGFFQSMGWPPIVRLMAYWFPSTNRGAVMGLLGTCYQLGGAASWFLAFFLTGYYVNNLGGDWRAVFAVPAVLFALAGVAFFLFVRDRPEDVGVASPDAEGPQREEHAEPVRTIRTNLLSTLSNPYLWIVAGTFFLLDVNRYGFVNWLPAYLDAQGGPQASTLLGSLGEVMKRCIHPLAGSAGAILAGWATDRFFGGRRAPVIAILLTLLGLFSIAFPYIGSSKGWLVITVVGIIGFCTYGPHILMVGHAAQDFGRKHGAAGAAGFIDAMGYIGASLAGWGAGALIRSRGYEVTFVTFGSAAILGAALISFIWKAGPGSRPAVPLAKPSTSHQPLPTKDRK